MHNIHKTIIFETTRLFDICLGGKYVVSILWFIVQTDITIGNHYIIHPLFVFAPIVFVVANAKHMSRYLHMRQNYCASQNLKTETTKIFPKPVNLLPASQSFKSINTKISPLFGASKDHGIVEYGAELKKTPRAPNSIRFGVFWGLSRCVQEE